MKFYKYNLTKIGISLCLLAIPMLSSVAYAKNVALLIGVGDYQHDVPDLKGPTNDVAAIKDALIKHWQFQQGDIVTLVDVQANRANILTQLEALQTRTQPGDEVLIYFSGHGTSVHDREFLQTQLGEDVLSSNSGALVPYDASISKINTELQSSPASAIKNNQITGQHHLRPVLSRLDKDRRVTVIIDACYSGHSARSLDASKMVARNIPLSLPTTFASSPTISHADAVANNKYPYQNVVSIGASHHTQKAYEDNTVTLSGKHHGLLTDALLRIMTGNNAYSGTLTYGKLKSLVERQFQSYNLPGAKNQTPMIQPFVEEEQHARLMHRPLFGNAIGLAGTTARAVAPLRVLTANQSEIQTHLQTGSMVEFVKSGSVDFEIAKSMSNGWSLSLGNRQMVAQDLSVAQVVNRLRAGYWLKQIEKSVVHKANISFVAKPEHKGNQFDAGDVVQFAATINQDAAVLLFNISSRGYINILYPIMPTENRMHKANQKIVVPDDDSLVVQPPFGYDQLVLVVLKAPLTDAERGRLSPLFSDNAYTIDSHVVAELTKIIEQNAIGLQTLGIQTYQK